MNVIQGLRHDILTQNFTFKYLANNSIFPCGSNFNGNQKRSSALMLTHKNEYAYMNYGPCYGGTKSKHVTYHII